MLLGRLKGVDLRMTNRYHCHVSYIYSSLITRPHYAGTRSSVWLWKEQRGQATGWSWSQCFVLASRALPLLIGFAWSEGWRPPGTQSAFIKLTG